MMGIPPGDARELSLWEYETLLWHWNDAHDIEPAAPDPDRARKMVDSINANPMLTH